MDLWLWDCRGCRVFVCGCRVYIWIPGIVSFFGRYSLHGLTSLGVDMFINLVLLRGSGGGEEYR